MGIKNERSICITDGNDVIESEVIRSVELLKYILLRVINDDSVLQIGNLG